MGTDSDVLPNDFKKILERLQSVLEKLRNTTEPRERRDHLLAMRFLLLEADEKMQERYLLSENSQTKEGSFPGSSIDA
jgi:hypothetical protein